MSGPDESRILESAFGSLADWLALVRQHEDDRRARLAALERARRDQATRVVMGILTAATLAVLVWIVRG